MIMIDNNRDAIMAAHIESWLEAGIDFLGRKIILDSEIDSDIATKINKAIILMAEQNKDPITFIINTEGGCVYESLGIYDTLRELSEEGCKIITKGIAKVMSGGSVIYIAGDERICGENCTFMIHGVGSATGGKTDEMDIDVKECKRLEKLLSALFEERTGRKASWWMKFLKKHDQYINKTKAIEYGIVTK